MARTKSKKPRKNATKAISRKEEFLALHELGNTEYEIRQKILSCDTNDVKQRALELKKQFKSEMLYANYMAEHAMDRDFVIGSLLNIYGKATTSQPVLDKDGVATGEYKEDLRTALKAMELIGREIGMFKNSVVVEDKRNNDRAQELIEEFKDVIEIKAEKDEPRKGEKSDSE